jgi:outer membrane receptor protein involved in Fe transport
LTATAQLALATASQAQDVPTPVTGQGITSADKAVAASQPPSADNAADQTEVVVTGSRLPSTHLNSSAPVTVLDRTEIDRSNKTSVGELLRDLPVAGASATDTAGRGNDGSANIALRGLSAVNTLVLINGRRVLPNTADGTVDLNSIPFEAVDRVEVLQDGASAVYGSDAIAGVVNVIMKHDYDGLMVKGGYGISSRGDLPNRELSGTFGKKFDDGGFVFVASYRKSGGNLIGDRPISRDPDWRSMGGRNYRDPYPIRAAFIGIPGSNGQQLEIKEGVTQATSIADFRPYIYPGTGDPNPQNDGINYWDYESSAAAIKQLNLYFAGDYDVAPGVNAFVEATYSNRKSLGFLAPDYFGDGQVTVSKDNMYNPFGVDLVVQRTILEQPHDEVRENSVNSNTYRVVMGLKGDFSSTWKWDVSANFQHLGQYTYAGRGLVLNRLLRAAGPTDACLAVAGCVPINLFGGVGTITQDMLKAITAEHFRNINSSLRAATANVSGKLFSLPYGDVNLAIGAEYREERFSQIQDSDTDYTVQNPPFFPPTRKVAEVYAETAVPLLKDLPLIKSLDVDAAVRYSHYNQFGNTVNPKFGVKWRMVPDLLIRGSWGTGFRAPNFTEANSAQTRTYHPVNDPCQTADYASYPGCGGKSAPITTGTWILSGANPNLKPETAKNLTTGFVYTPHFIPRLAITVDYYRITKSNIIGTADANYIILQNAKGDASFEVDRNPDNSIAQVSAIRDNLLDEEIRGLDVEADYTTEEFSWGKLNVRGDVTYLDSYKLSPAPGQPAVENVGTYTIALGTLSRWRGNGSMTWSKDGLALTWAVRYVGSVTNDASLLVNGKHLKADDYLQNDLSIEYLFKKPQLKISASVENLFDRMPPWLEGNYANGFDNLTFNSRGRYFTFRVQKMF